MIPPRAGRTASRRVRGKALQVYQANSGNWRANTATSLADLGETGFVAGVGDGGVDPARHLNHVLLAETAGRERGRSDADAGGHERGTGLERHGVLVHGDAGGVEGVLGVLAR